MFSGCVMVRELSGSTDSLLECLAPGFLPHLFYGGCVVAAGAGEWTGMLGVLVLTMSSTLSLASRMTFLTVSRAIFVHGSISFSNCGRVSSCSKSWHTPSTAAASGPKVQQFNLELFRVFSRTHWHMHCRRCTCHVEHNHGRQWMQTISHQYSRRSR